MNMKIKLIRNLETKRNKEQEDSFVLTMNFNLYFDINKTINKIDGWKKANVQKIVDVLNEKIDEKEIEIEYSSWNDNLEYLKNNAKIQMDFSKSENNELEEVFNNLNIIKIHEYLLKIKNDKNLKYEFLLKIIEELKDNKKAIEIANVFLNERISTLDLAIELLMPLLIERITNA
ncbi:MAG: hypothetical protein TYPL_0070 [Candidatus Tyloplasma litorale]|nr:MAG: hypothetical protein TYPL_0070 [Mycoplasmatales bacterium]